MGWKITEATRVKRREIHGWLRTEIGGNLIVNKEIEKFGSLINR